MVQIWSVYQFWCLNFKLCIFEVKKWSDCSKNALKIWNFLNNFNGKFDNISLTSFFLEIFFVLLEKWWKNLSNHIHNRRKFEFKFSLAFFGKTDHFKPDTLCKIKHCEGWWTCLVWLWCLKILFAQKRHIGHGHIWLRIGFRDKS